MIRIFTSISICFFCLNIYAQDVIKIIPGYVLIKGASAVNHKFTVWRYSGNVKEIVGEIVTLRVKEGNTAGLIISENPVIRIGDFISRWSKAVDPAEYIKESKPPEKEESIVQMEQIPIEVTETMSYETLIDYIREDSTQSSLPQPFIEEDVLKMIFSNDNLIVLESGSIYKIDDKHSKDIAEWSPGHRLILIDGVKIINSETEFKVAAAKKIE